jgi:chemotaxis protein MotB
MNERPIIVIKKKGGHGGHHGGAWKVAYADFVTAMMSLFIVLWLLNSTPQVKKAIAGYFNDPRGTSRQMGTDVLGEGKSVVIDKANVEKLKESISKAMIAQKELDKLKNQVELTITPEGLRIELIEGKNGTFFQSGGSKLSPSGEELVGMLAEQLKPLPNHLFIEGHTDSQPYSGANGYSNWELSSDRANATRRLLQQDGVRTDQITQVRGFADQALRVPSDPLDPSNRRVSLIVNWTEAPAGTVGPETLDTEHKGASEDKPGEGSKPAAATAAAPLSEPGTQAPAPAPPARSSAAEAQPVAGRIDLPTKPSAATPAKPADARPSPGKIDLATRPVGGSATSKLPLLQQMKQADAARKPQP